MKSLETWLNEYAQSHQNQTNKIIHLFAVPLILWSSLGLLWWIPSPLRHVSPYLNWALPAVLFIFAFYARLSVRLALGMLVVMGVQLMLINWAEPYLPRSLLEVSFMVFATSWIFQFFGHKIEGERPSFMKDLQFLLIGPLWVLHAVYRKLGIST